MTMQDRTLQKTTMRQRWQSAAGLASPLTLLASIVAVAMIALSISAIVIDRERTQQEAIAAAKAVADIARQRTADLFARADASLRAVEAVAAGGGTGGGVTGAAIAGGERALLDDLIAQRRRAEPRLLALYVLDRNGSAVAGTSNAPTRAASIVAECIRNERPEPEQIVLRAIMVEQSGGGGLQGICVTRGFQRGGVNGAVLGVIAADLLGAQFADLGVGGHGVVVVLDENARPLVAVRPSQSIQLAPSTAPAPLTDWVTLSRGTASATAGGGIIETRLIERPFGAIVALVIPAGDVLAAWQARAVQALSASGIVALFITLATLAVRRAERREGERLERIAALTLDLRGRADAEALMRRVAETAREMTGGTLATPMSPDMAESTEFVREPELSLPRAQSVRLGAHILHAAGRAGFTAEDLTILTILSRLGAVHVQASTRLAEAEAAITSLQTRAEDYRAGAEALLLEMPDATFTLDAEWRISSTNRNADRLFGEYAEDVRGRSVWEVFPELEGGVFEAECRRVIAGRHAREFEMKWLRTETWLMASVHPRSAGVVVYLQDISRQVTTDERLREAGKMEAIGRLTGGIAHDFNNLLTVILGNVEMLDGELPESGEARDMHEQIRRAALSAAERTHQMLAFARRQPLSPREVDVTRLLIGLDGLLRRSLGAGGTLEISCPATLWKVRVDPAQLENAVVSLAQNACEAIPAGRGGRLVVEGANTTIRKLEVDRFGELHPGNYVVISLSDNGVGIPRDVIGKVFEPFFSTKTGGRGTGLGLAMVYGFVTQSGGHVRLVSQENRGSTVRLYLPAQSDARSDSTTSPAVPAAANSLAGGQRILVVEDSDMVRGYTRNVLSSLGYDVTSVSDGAQALARIEAGDKPDLLLTDVLLPDGMNGIAVAEQVLRRLPGLPVIYMSGYVEDVDIDTLKLDPRFNLLLKPFRRAALAQMVRARLDNENVK